LVPWVFHKSQVVRDLSLIGRLLEGILGEYLVRFLEVFMLVLAGIEDFFIYELSLLFIASSDGSLFQFSA
jgi:hypothetical protein